MAPWITWWAYLLAAVLLGLLARHAWQRRASHGDAVRPAPLSILVIVHNQEDNIEAFMRELLGGSVGTAPPALDYELVMVDAGSTDDTWAILSRLAYGRPGVRALRWRGGPGADPFQAGHMICRHPIIVAVDLTSSTDLRSTRLTLARLIGGIHGSDAFGSGSTPGPGILTVQPDQEPAGS